MKKFKFKKIDAFATEKSSGNPAGYISLNSSKEISEEEMQKIAIELKGFVNEVGYVFPISEKMYKLKYYSSEREVEFCGHATIAIMYDVIKNNRRLLECESVLITTNRGELIVENRIENENAVFITAPLPYENNEIPNVQKIADKLGIDVESIDLTLPISIVNAGLDTLLVPIKNLNSILKINPNLEILKEFCFKSNIDIIEVFTSETIEKGNDFRTRVFAPTFGYIEDPATGSGNSAFGYYLMKNELWKGDVITIEQNGLQDKFNIVKLRKQKDKEGNERILFGGGALTRIDGEYILN